MSSVEHEPQPPPAAAPVGAPTTTAGKPSAEQVIAGLRATTEGGEDLVQLLTPEGERVSHPAFDVDIDDEQLRGLYRDMVLVRAFDRRHMMELSGIDLAFTVREVFESAVVMGREALGLFCVGEEDVARVEQEYRDRDRERLDEQSRSGDLHAMKDSMFGPDNRMAEREG